jgi:hypothetical protein
MDRQAYNYNANASSNDGSCRYHVEGCKDREAENFDAWADEMNNTLCSYPPPPPPSWYEKLDIRYFMWGGIGLALMCCLCKIRTIVRKLRYVAPEEAEEEVMPLDGKFMMCSRCQVGLGRIVALRHRPSTLYSNR